MGSLIKHAKKIKKACIGIATGVTVAMPNVVVTATDACGNRDLNFTGAVTLNSTGTITGAPLSVNAVAGVATFSNIIHSVIGTNYQMTASAVGLTNGLSNLYDIFAITQLQRGDLAIIAVNTEIGSGTDQSAFVCFEDIRLCSFLRFPEAFP